MPVRKAPTKKRAKEEAKPESKPILPSKTFYAVGRRKTAVAQVLVSSGNGAISVNNVAFETYFPTDQLQSIAKHPLAALGLMNSINVKAKIHSGGIHAQSEALRHALARAIVGMNPESRTTLKKLGFLTRDPRVKERKKPGLKRARRAPQFSKR
ncbi:MAG: 30S ribosomal protein S9 [Candidatus Doudnabacteria bacterium]|nr:30S ribosomal protein S9 [Candidatus Doudnabacteria bacterium]